jgi:hypothetical protein
MGIERTHTHQHFKGKKVNINSVIYDLSTINLTRVQHVISSSDNDRSVDE